MPSPLFTQRRGPSRCHHPCLRNVGAPVALVDFSKKAREQKGPHEDHRRVAQGFFDRGGHRARERDGFACGTGRASVRCTGIAGQGSSAKDRHHRHQRRARVAREPGDRPRLRSPRRLRRGPAREARRRPRDDRGRRRHRAGQPHGEPHQRRNPRPGLGRLRLRRHRSRQP